MSAWTHARRRTRLPTDPAETPASTRASGTPLTIKRGDLNAPNRIFVVRLFSEGGDDHEGDKDQTTITAAGAITLAKVPDYCAGGYDLPSSELASLRLGHSLSTGRFAKFRCTPHRRLAVSADRLSKRRRAPCGLGQQRRREETC